MATTIYFRSAVAPVASTQLGTNNTKLNGSASGWRALALTTGRGPAAAQISATTVAGPTNGIEIGVFSTDPPCEWISEPLDQDVTISGNITTNLRAAESAMSVNAAICVIIQRLDSQGGIVSTILQTTDTEIATSESAENLVSTPTSTNMLKGDRFRIRVYADDATSLTMGAGTVTFWMDGPTAGASGDSYVTFTETFGFETTTPAGTQLFLTDAAMSGFASPTLISDFTGANEDPLSEGGNWAILDSNLNSLIRTSNQAATAANLAQSYWTPANYGPDVEAYVTLAAIATTSVRLCARIQNEGGAGTWDGYAAVINFGTPDTTLLYSVTNATLTILTSHTTTDWGAGDKLGISCLGSEISLWRFPSGGSNWQLVLRTKDTTYTAAGKLALGVGNNTSIRLDDFYAGSVAGSFSIEKQMWTSRGDGVNSIVRDTAAGWTPPLQWTDSSGGTVVEWYSKQLSGFTLGDLVRCNLRVLESSASANASVRAELAVCDADGSNAVVWGAGNFNSDTNFGEITTSEAATVIDISGDDVSVTGGQRLRLRVFVDDQSQLPLATGFTATLYYDGTSGGASGDSWIQLTQSVTEFAPSPDVVMAPYSPY